MMFHHFGLLRQGHETPGAVRREEGHILQTDANRLCFNPLARQTGVSCPKTMQSYKISANYANIF